MNVKEVVKKYQDDRRQAAELIKALQQAAVPFLQQIQDISKFTNNLFFDIAYRRQSLQNAIANVMDSIDSASHELQLLDTDCSLQIQRLISRQQLLKAREEMQHAKGSSTKVVRQPRVERKSRNRKKSSG